MTQSTIPTKQLPVVTTIGTPGSDASIPTEQAVREAFNASTNTLGTRIYIYTYCI